jgi:hypothetical protein
MKLFSEGENRRKWLTPGERAVMQKDFNEIWKVRMVRNTLILVPALLVVILPVVYLLMIWFVPPERMNGVEQMMKLVPPYLRGYFSARQSLFYLMENVVCPMFFLMIPLMVSTVTAACSFVGEKERGTIETLLLTPLRVRSLFKAKVFGCALVSLIVTGISFFAFLVVVGIGDLLLKMPFFLNWNWIVMLLVVSPSLTLFGVIFMVLVSGRSKSYMESMQLSGYVVLPLVLLMIGQFTGLFQLDALILLAIGAGVFVLDFILGGISARSFTPEKLMK